MIAQIFIATLSQWIVDTIEGGNGEASVLPIGLDTTIVAIYVGFFYANLKCHFKAGKS